MTPWPDEMTQTWRCLSSPDLASYADGELTGWRRMRCERHVARCVHCRNELAFLLRTERMPLHALPPGWMERARALAQAPAPAATWRWAWTGVAVLLVCAALGIRALLPRAPQPIAVNSPPASAASAAPAPLPEVRNVEPSQVRRLGRGEAPIAISVERSGMGSGVQFRWKAVPSAVTYELRVLDEAGDTVWQTRTHGEQLRLPPDVPLKPGLKYFALIIASLPNGKAVRSRATPFETVSHQDH